MIKPPHTAQYDAPSPCLRGRWSARTASRGALKLAAVALRVSGRAAPSILNQVPSLATVASGDKPRASDPGGLPPAPPLGPKVASPRAGSEAIVAEVAFH